MSGVTSNDASDPTAAVVSLTSAPSLATTFARAVATSRGRSGDELPGTAYELSVTVDRDRLADYQRLCGFAVGDVLPPTYPHVLGFPLQAHLMADRRFPLALPGLVHLANEITVARPLLAGETLLVTVSAADLRPHPKGRLVDLLTSADVEGERFWSGRSTYLQRGSGSADADPGSLGPSVPDGPVVARWRLPSDLGRRYAAVSGDVNPIHLSSLTARAMGFPRAIAHGMWTYARTLAALGPATDVGTSQVWFRKPVLLPSTVALTVDRRAEGTTAGLTSAKDPSIEHLAVQSSPRIAT